MEPATMALMASAAKGGSDAFQSYLDSKAKKKIAKMQAQESRRKTFADMLNQALERSFRAQEGGRERGVDLAKARAAALQNIASQYVQTFR